MEMMPMQEQNVKICKGPGCKAWSSDQIAREIIGIRESLGLKAVRVCRVPCMKVCGGGTSIRVNGKQNIVKLKHSKEFLYALDINKAVTLA
jgi:hypothetical protein